MRKKKREKHSKKIPVTKKEKAVADENTNNSGLRTAFDQAFSSGWVQNSGVGFLFTFITLIVAVVMKTQIKATAITFALAGTAALWILALAIIKYSVPENLPFALAIETSWKGKVRDATQIFCEYNQKFISPVPIALFIRVVNNQDVPSNISQLKVEVELESGKWIFPSTWLQTVPISDNMPLLWVNPPPSPARRLSLIGPRLQPILASRALAPHETVRGWVFLDVPPEYDSAVFPTVFRISAKDTAGKSISVLDSGDKAEENVFPDRGWEYTDVIDINGFTVKHLAKDSK